MTTLLRTCACAVLLAGLAACSSADKQPVPLPPHVAERPAAGETADQPTLTETYWKAVELMGKPVPEGNREAYIILKKDTNQVAASGGCNGMGSSYELKGMDRIRFTPAISTQMACAKGMDTDRVLGEVLERTDSYTLANGRLQLNRARMAPLAVFEPVYLR